jgi:hypothetical protein
VTQLAEHPLKQNRRRQSLAGSPEISRNSAHAAAPSAMTELVAE